MSRAYAVTIFSAVEQVSSSGAPGIRRKVEPLLGVCLFFGRGVHVPTAVVGMPPAVYRSSLKARAILPLRCDDH